MPGPGAAPAVQARPQPSRPIRGPGAAALRPASQGTLRLGWYSSRMPATEFEDFANECIGIARRARGTRDGDAMWRMARAWLVIAQVMAELKGEAEAATRRAI